MFSPVLRIADRGKYSHLQSPIDDDSCVQLCVERILNILPKLYVTFIFLRFKIQDDNELGGEEWDENYNAGPLGQWLKGASGLHSASSSKAILLPGGYDGYLREVPEEGLVSLINDLLSGTDDDDGGCFQYLLLDLVTVTRWSPCSVATYLALVHGLCKKYAFFQSTSQTYKDTEDVLNKLSTNLKVLAPDLNEDKKALFTALFEGSPTKYSEHLTDAYFEGRMKWLNGM
ncbi:nicotinate phosphoribosyltransferase [Babesia caballi]|uniref:Nicotinate phosphoribosyltransferase n=1 Tax=Babesia caballi TaxID=5871 RepID=A0AAV4LNQ2_BABCB|nr:nicotinate phosphoribosyltransferase [Babesia caballi]